MCMQYGLQVKSTFDDAGIISPTAWTVLVSILVTIDYLKTFK